MTNSELEELKQETNPYNKEPVVFCRHCLSLRIRKADEMEFCDSCGSTSLENREIRDWEALYKAKYGINYINKK